MRDLHQSGNAVCGVSSVDGQHLLESSTSTAWLEAAAKLPGKSMHVAVVLLRLAALKRADRVVLSNRACEHFGLDRNAKYRALLSLEASGLIRVERKLGQSPIVDIMWGRAAS